MSSSNSLIDIARSRFLGTIRRVQPARKWKLLIVDDHVQKLLGVTLKQNEILQENVTVIENISRHREPQQLDAIYILMPTTQNVDRIISDFTGNSTQYVAAHLFFVDHLSDELAQTLISSPADPYIKTLEDLHINFWPVEAQVFSVKNAGSFFYMYSPLPNPSISRIARSRLEEELMFISKSIVDVCVTLGEYPYIRFYQPSHHPPLGSMSPPPLPKAVESQVPSRWRTNLARGPEYREHEELENSYLARVLAFMVQADLDEYKKGNPEFGKVRDARNRATLIITDRSMDTIAPFLHEFTYQAMCNDLLPIEDGTKYRYKFQSSIGEYEDKTAILSDADTVWTEVRHMHMRETIDKLMTDFNKFLQDNAGFKGEGAATLNDMKDMLASLPQYQEQREKFSLHLNMAQECMNIFEKKNLTGPAHVEQCCATGLTPEGKSPKNIVEEMVPLLDSKEVSNSTKARIIALYIQHRDGVPDEDKRRLFQHARLPIADQDAVNSLAHLGARLTRTSGDRDTKKRLKPKRISTDSEYELSRYQPLLRTVLEEHCASKLDTTVFPYVKDSPASASTARAAPTPQQPTSLRSAKATWHKAPSAVSRPAEARPKLIVFMAGGVTYSEMRTCYECSSSLGQDIYIGSTHILTPQHFIEDLRVLEISGVGSRALPKGFQHTGPDHRRSFQALYDQRYASASATPVAPPNPDSRDRGRAPPSQSARYGQSPSQGQGLAPLSAPDPRSSSVASYHSASGSAGEDKKKLKKKFFGF